MARRSYQRTRSKGWFYFILILIIIAAAVLLMYNYKRRPEKTVEEPVAEEIVVEMQVKETEPNEQAGKLIFEAMECINSKPAKIIKARDILNESLPLCDNHQQESFVKSELSKLSEQWLFSKIFFPEDHFCESYKVQPGELLSTIGNKFKVPWEILLEINNLGRPESLKAGQVIKIINGPFHARVNRETFTMDIYLQNSFIRSFNVGLGKPGMETPTGLWLVKVGGKMIRPPWTDPITNRAYEPDDPDYPLGSRWIALKGIEGNAVGRDGFAIHGTKEPNEIGTANSQGCIRLHNGDVITVYNLLIAGHSRVTVE